MAVVDLVIAGRACELACRDGEEAHLRTLAAMVDDKAVTAARAMGGMSEARQMLFAALMLADELNDARAARAAATAAAPPELPAPPPELDGILAQAVERLAERLERLAETIAPADAAGLETAPANA